MTRKIGNNLIIEPTDPAKCEFCEKVEELRPYGPEGESICFDCAMKDEQTTLRKFYELMEGPGERLN